MERITKGMLDSKIEFLNKEHGLNLDVGGAYGRYQLQSVGGSINVSTPGTKRDVYDQLRAIQEVLYLKNKIKPIPMIKNKVKSKKFRR